MPLERHFHTAQNVKQQHRPMGALHTDVLNRIQEPLDWHGRIFLFMASE